MSLYITTACGMCGWFAVMIDDGDGFPEPVTSDIESHETFEGAQREAKEWARAAGLEYRP